MNKDEKHMIIKVLNLKISTALEDNVSYRQRIKETEDPEAVNYYLQEMRFTSGKAWGLTEARDFVENYF